MRTAREINDMLAQHFHADESRDHALQSQLQGQKAHLAALVGTVSRGGVNDVEISEHIQRTLAGEV